LIGKNYEHEAELVLELIGLYKRSTGRRLLDVACGTGRHASYFERHYEVEGVDLDGNMLELARRRCPHAAFHRADMTDFDLGQRFDVVTCLFSSIGYARSTENLRRAIVCMARHLEPGGVLLVEPWLLPEVYRPGKVHAVFVDEPELKLARVNLSEQRERLAVLDFHYLVGTPRGIERFAERHELGLFTHEEYLESIDTAGLEPVHDPEGLTGRGLYIGLRALESV